MSWWDYWNERPDILLIGDYQRTLMEKFRRRCMYNEPHTLVAKEASDCRPPSLLERLHDERKRLSARVADIDAALEALEQDPKVMETLELISKVTHL